ncbi:BRE4-like protein [Mya arenaria]|uniref:Beta-1,4-galactosyltransferase n=1 Tax=Mya arenaria TaxID=6604 RepID=A0ABY7EIZ4_MYAAR|nr:BRE4-like protein [Mya arenaria]
MQSLFAQIERIIESMMKPDYLQVNLNQELQMSEIYAERIKQMIRNQNCDDCLSNRLKLRKAKLNDTWRYERKSRVLHFVQSPFTPRKTNEAKTSKSHITGMHPASKITPGRADNFTDIAFEADYSSPNNPGVRGNSGTHSVTKCPENPAALKSAPPPAAHDVLPGGAWSPNSCVARQRIAIIIPFRDRQKHLDILLYYLVPVLTRQQVAFQVFVVEQYGNKAFNKGRLMNIGFTEARKHDEFDCFIFHDVDLIPEDDRNMYTCSENPRHMSPAVDKLGYKLPYKALVGGVLSIKPEHYSRVNGYSNLYWGWGAEDDDMYYRYYLLRTVRKRFLKDGLNTLEYRLVDTRLEKLYTRIVADVGDPPKNSDKISAFVT